MARDALWARATRRADTADDALTALKAGHPCTDRAQPAGPLVAEHGRRQHVSIGVSVNVGAANAGIRDLDDDASGLGLGEPFGDLP
nr:hypothetical protein [Haloactinopolyspora alba]